MSIHRRKFLGTTLLASAAALVPMNAAAALLQRPDAGAKVFAILAAKLGLADSHRKFVDTFAQRLATGTQHRQAAIDFVDKIGLSKEGPDEALEAYVVQEFIIATNYLEYAAGDSEVLIMHNEP